MSWISYHWMGVFVYLLLLFLVSDLVIFLAKIFKILPTTMFQSIAFYRSLIVVLLTVGVVGYGIYNANQIKYTSYNIEMKNFHWKMI